MKPVGVSDAIGVARPPGARPLRRRLQESAAWLVVPAVAMAVSLGVTLPTPARAQTALSNTASGVVLANPAYLGATYFSAASGIGISNSGNAVYGDATQLWTLTNQGTITSSAADGVNFANGGSVDNSGTISSGADARAVYIQGGAGTVTNEGFLQGGTMGSARGVYLLAGGTVTNGSTINTAAEIYGHLGVYTTGGLGTVINYGTIIGNAVQGVLLNQGGSLANFGTIINGIEVDHLPGTITNYGAITSMAGTAAALGSGSVYNGHSATMLGSTGISGSDLTVTNYGSIAGSVADGILLTTGTIINSGTAATITGGSGGNGVDITGYGTVTNSGTITTTSTNGDRNQHPLGGIGVYLGTGGGVTNLATGYISGSLSGVRIKNGAGTVINYGTIKGTGTTTDSTSSAIFLGYGGSITNQSSGVLFDTAGELGVLIQDGPSGTLTNDGNITGNVVGALLEDETDTVTNTGSITGNVGVLFSGDSTGSTLVNGGAIIGNGGTAVQFSGTGNNLTLLPGYSFTGLVEGTGSDTLEFAGTITNPGTFTGLATEFIGFTNLTVDSGADWTFTGTTSIGSSGTLTNSGSLTNAGTLTSAGLVNNYGDISGGITLTGGSLVNKGSIEGAGDAIAGTTSAVTVTNYGSITGGIDYGVHLTKGGLITNHGSGSIYGHFAGIGISGAAGTVTNYGLITGGTGINFGTGNTYNNTVINGGSITGTSGTAIRFGAGDDVMVLLPGSAIGGTVDGGAGSNTLEFGGTSPGYFSGLGGSQYINFGAITVDSGADWTFTGNNAVGLGITLTNSGALTNQGSLINDGVIVNDGAFYNSGLLTNYGSITSTGSAAITQTGGTIINYGSLSYISGGTFGIKAIDTAATITNDGTIKGGDIGIYLGAGGTVTNGTSGTNLGQISGSFYGVYAKADASVTNYGAITAGQDGVKLLAGGTVFNGGTASYLRGYTRGVLVSGAAGTITNEGTIKGSYGTAIELDAGGTITNYGTIRSGTSGGINLTNGGAITNGNTGNNSALISGYYYGIQALGAQATIFNYGTITANSGVSGSIGITLANGGTVTNQGSAFIYGLATGVKITGAAGTVINYGSIAGGCACGAGVYLGGGGTIVNGGTANSTAQISGASGIYIRGAAGTITNYGTILGNSNAGVYLSAGSSLTNVGAASSVYGQGWGVRAFYGPVTISNQGAITSSTDGIGIQLYAGGSVTNSGTASYIHGGAFGVLALSAPVSITNEGTISSHKGGVYHGIYQDYPRSAVYLGAGGTITNSGTITSDLGIGVVLGGGGTITNSGTASLIAGYHYGIVTYNSAATIVNEGKITSGQYGVATPPRPYEAGVSLLAGGTITNSGTIAGYNPGLSSGIYLGLGGTIHNNGGAALIEGYATGIYSSSGYAVITNEGTIRSLAPSAPFTAGIFLRDGGNITNNGIIAGGAAGIVSYGPTTIFNTSLIYGAAGGIGLIGGGSVTNSGTASSITGSMVGLSSYGGSVAVTNEGFIGATGGGGEGIRIVNIGPGSYSAAITNSGTIMGDAAGVAVIGVAGTVTNNGGTIAAITGPGVGFDDSLGTFNNTVTNTGTISGGSGVAVQFGGGDDLMQVGSGAVFGGVVDGGGGANTLEFLSGTALLTSVGSEYLSFQTIKLDAAATLDITGATSLGAGETLDNGGTFDTSGNFTIAGVLNNTGHVVNSGTLTIAAGGTLNNQGNLGNSGTIIGPTDGLVGGGTISNTGTIIGTAGSGVDFTSPGSLANTGTIKGGTYGAKLGAGATVTNSGTVIDDGVAGVALGSGSSFTNAAGGTLSGVTGAIFTGTGATLTNAGTITGSGGIAVQFDAGSNQLILAPTSILNGTIDGGGGAGQIVLTGTGTFNNIVNNFGAGSALALGSGANWIVNGNLKIAAISNAGTLQAGTLGAPLKISGNFIQTSAGTLRVLLDPSGSSTQLQAGGTATLAGSVLLVPTGTLSPTRYTLITAAGGVSGSFSSVSGAPALLNPSLSTDATNAYVTLAQLSVASLPQETPNQLAAATAFDAGRAASPTAFATELSVLNQLSAPDVKTALDRLSGESNADLSTNALTAGELFIGQFQQHSLAAKSSGQLWNLWATAYGQSGWIGGNGNAHRLNQGVTGGTLGADYQATPDLRLGGMAGFGQGRFNVAGGLGNARVQYKEIAVTGIYGQGPLTVTGLLGGVFGNGSTSRNTQLTSATPITANAKIANQQFLGALEAGYAMPLNDMTLTPFAGLQAGSVDQNSFTETGAGILNLQAADRTTSSVKSLLGARLASDLPVGGTIFTTTVKLAWAHELSPTARLASLSFAGGKNFIIAGAPVPGDSAIIGFGVAATVFDNASLYVNYDGDFARTATSNTISGGIRLAW